LIGDPHRRACDAVDIGREGLCDVGDSHVLNGRSRGCMAWLRRHDDATNFR
jgi:hypothetical protein